MSEATIFEFPYNLFIKQRLEFVVICHDQIAAAIMRIVECEMIKQKEAWQNKVTTAVEAKKTPPKEPAEYWVRLSHGQIIAKLYYYDSGKLEKPGEEATEKEIKEYLRKKGISLSKTTIRRTINLLIDLGFLLMRSKPGDEFGAPLYTLHRKNVQKALKSLPANPFSIFNQWEGVSNLEGGVSKLESGELAESEEGVSKLESGEFPKTKVNKDNKEISSKTSKDNLKEDTDTRVAVANATPASSSQTLVSLHPKHGFLWGDDHLNPTRVVVYLTPAFPSRYYSEVEDKRREQIVAYEIMPYLEAKGLKVSLQWKHETEQEIEQALAANENKTEPVGETSEVNRSTNLPDPLDEKIVNADEAVSRNVAETQERATSSAVIETQGDTRNTTTEQTEPNIRIAQEVQQQEAEEQPASNKKRTTKPKPERPAGPPEMPPTDVRFTAEVAVQIIEAKKGRRYSEATRTQELSAAKKVLGMEYEDEGITRERFEAAVDDLLSWPFWKQHTNVKPMIRTLLKDDKIINILDDLKKKSGKNRPSLSKQREDVHRQAAVTVATSVPPIDAEKLDAEKQAKAQQARENIAKLNRRLEEKDAKLRGVM